MMRKAGVPIPPTEPLNKDQDRYRFVDSAGELLGESKFVKMANGARRVEELIIREQSPAITPTTGMIRPRFLSNIGTI